MRHDDLRVLSFAASFIGVMFTLAVFV